MMATVLTPTIDVEKQIGARAVDGERPMLVWRWTCLKIDLQQASDGGCWTSVSSHRDAAKS
jgi:hypothetical protein